MFYESLICSEKSELIPEEYNYYGKLIGSWEFTWVNPDGSKAPGEWHWAWINGGTAIIDVFVPLSPGASTGVQTRFFNINTKKWDMLYGQKEYTRRLTAEKRDEKVIASVIPDDDEPWTIGEKWVFVEINDNDFHWQNIKELEDGTWQVNADVYGKRIKNI